MYISEQFHQQIIIFSLLVTEKIIKKLEKTFKTNLTYTEFYTLSIINHMGSMSMTAFAERFSIKKQQATRVVNKLVQKGLIERISDETDRRVILIDLTEKAKTYFAEYTAENIKQISSYFSCFSESELLELQSAIETINKMLSQL